MEKELKEMLQEILNNQAVIFYRIQQMTDKNKGVSRLFNEKDAKNELAALAKKLF